MPSCRPDVIPKILYKVMDMRPNSIVEVGIGFGKWGVMCKEYLKYWMGVDVRITGIEVFGGYANTAYGVYNKVVEKDVMSVLGELEDADLVLAVDVIEHLRRKDGERMLAAIGNRYIVTTPGYWSSQGTCFGNEHEQHRSQWKEDDFANSEVVVDVFGRSHIIGWR